MRCMNLRGWKCEEFGNSRRQCITYQSSSRNMVYCRLLCTTDNHKHASNDTTDTFFFFLANFTFQLVVCLCMCVCVCVTFWPESGFVWVCVRVCVWSICDGNCAVESSHTHTRIKTNYEHTRSGRAYSEHWAVSTVIWRRAIQIKRLGFWSIGFLIYLKIYWSTNLFDPFLIMILKWQL